MFESTVICVKERKKERETERERERQLHICILEPKLSRTFEFKVIHKLHQSLYVNKFGLFVELGLKSINSYMVVEFIWIAALFASFKNLDSKPELSSKKKTLLS